MCKFLILLPPLIVLVSGCMQTVKSDPSETRQIIQILETEDINSISTSHSQDIAILLKDGREFHGKYVHKHAGVYTQDEHLFDILNLVLHIQKKRSASETLSWSIMAE